METTDGRVWIEVERRTLISLLGIRKLEEAERKTTEYLERHAYENSASRNKAAKVYWGNYIGQAADTSIQSLTER